jgi:hypothetical protein
MTGNTRSGTVLAIGGLFAAIALLAAFLAGCQPARTPGPQSGGQPGVGGPATGPPVGAGSFPRSFLIPGTDTSISIGGYSGSGFRVGL